MKVSVIGGGGRVGFPMCLVMANAGHKVVGIDKDSKKNELIMKGKIPFKEEGAKKYLQRVLSENRLEMTQDYEKIGSSEIVVIIIGTPIDEHLNPDLTGIHNLFKRINPYLSKNQSIILRSTVAPGTTRRVRDLIEQETGLEVGVDIYLAFAPERVLQGKAIREIPSLPQHIGTFDEASYRQVEKFFQTFIDAQCLHLSPVEAELGKLMTNMARYVNFALANEYHLIADSFNANANRIIDACNLNYPRMDLPRPGPNVGGPCLHKDGWFLLERIPYNELIGTAFKINEGMPAHIVEQIGQYEGVDKVVILGMTFKANSDDTRNSVSFKLRKQLEARGYQVVLIEPNLDNYANLERSELSGSDVVVLMTPHSEFKDLKEIINMVDNPDCLFVDIWGEWEEMRYESDNGYFKAKEVQFE